MSRQLLSEAQKEIIVANHGQEVKGAVKPLTELAAKYLNNGNILALTLLLESVQALSLEMIEKGMAIQNSRGSGEDEGVELKDFVRGVEF
jgi:hypothetical protein